MQIFLKDKPLAISVSASMKVADIKTAIASQCTVK
jgi:hypothetical protein